MPRRIEAADARVAMEFTISDGIMITSPNPTLINPRLLLRDLRISCGDVLFLVYLCLMVSPA